MKKKSKNIKDINDPIRMSFGMFAKEKSLLKTLFKVKKEEIESSFKKKIMWLGE